MKNKPFILIKLLSTAVFVITWGLMLSCGRSSEMTPIAAGQTNAGKDKQMGSPTPSSKESNNETAPQDLSSAETVTYCELIKDPANYDRKIVRVRGIYFNGFERMFFYDEHCVRNAPARAPKIIPAETWIEWDNDYSRKDDSKEAQAYRAVKSGERKDVTVVGRFLATRDVNNTGGGKFQLRVMRVKKLRILRNSTRAGPGANRGL